MEHQSTAQQCADSGIKYEPLVFTAQGGIQHNAEAIISQLADAIARVEDKHAALVKSEILHDLSLTLVRHTAQAIYRRRPRQAWLRSDACARYLLAANAEEG